MGAPVKLLFLALLATGMQGWEARASSTSSGPTRTQPSFPAGVPGSIQAGLGQTQGQGRSHVVSPQYTFISETGSWSQPIYPLLVSVLESCERTRSLLSLPSVRPWIRICEYTLFGVRQPDCLPQEGHSSGIVWRVCQAMKPHCLSVTQSLLSTTCQVAAVASAVHTLCECGTDRIFPGSWSVWTQWGQCACTGGSGVRSRSRKCYPEGALCYGVDMETAVCDFRECPVPGSWSVWTQWGQCACTGGSGVRSRSRKCYPEGALCYGVDMETAVCDFRECPAPQCSARIISKIFGGVPASACEFPYLVALKEVGSSDYFFCGGVIINSTAILTAAHCVSRSFEVHAGKYHRSSAEDRNRQDLQVAAVAEFIIHPSYNNATYSNDIAVVTLKTSLRWTGCVLPACLPEPQEKPDFSVNCVSAGWGKMDNYNPSPVLMKVSLSGFSLDECRTRFPLANSERMFSPGDICAAGAGRDTCQGDSGGPLLCQSTSGLFKTFGLVSHGHLQCAHPDYPGVYTEVANFMNFVRQSL